MGDDFADRAYNEAAVSHATVQRVLREGLFRTVMLLQVYLFISCAAGCSDATPHHARQGGVTSYAAVPYCSQ